MPDLPPDYLPPDLPWEIREGLEYDPLFLLKRATATLSLEEGDP